MTFQLSFDEWMEGHRVFARAQNRFLPLMPLFLGALAGLFLFVFVLQPDVMSGLLMLLFVWGFLEVSILWRLRLRAMFRRQCSGDESPPISYEFSTEHIVWRTSNGETILSWTVISKRLEGPKVWLLVVRAKKPFFLIIPRRATQSDPGRVGWGVVDAHFAPPSSAPIASPH